MTETTGKPAGDDGAEAKKKEHHPLPEFNETVIVKKPLGLRIHKTGLVVTMVEPNAAANGKAFVGDSVVSVDNKKVADFSQLTKILKEPTPIVPVRFRRNAFSFCRHLGTTVERLQLDKDVTKVTNRAIDVFQVTFSIKGTLSFDYGAMLGFVVKYDARERVTVASVDAGSIASIHLRPGDVIRDVNDNAIASKTMLQFHMMESMWEEGLTRLTIECAAGGDDAYRDQIEMSQDVLDIATKQIQQFRSNSLKPTSIFTRDKTPKGRVSIAKTERVEVEIDADHDPAKLKSCKHAKN